MVKPKNDRVIPVEVRGRIIGWFVTQGYGVYVWARDGARRRPLGFCPTWREGGDALLEAAGLPPVKIGAKR